MLFFLRLKKNHNKFSFSKVSSGLLERHFNAARLAMDTRLFDDRRQRLHCLLLFVHADQLASRHCSVHISLHHIEERERGATQTITQAKASLAAQRHLVQFIQSQPLANVCWSLVQSEQFAEQAGNDGTGKTPLQHFLAASLVQQQQKNLVVIQVSRSKEQQQQWEQLRIS